MKKFNLRSLFVLLACIILATGCSFKSSETSTVKKRQETKTSKNKDKKDNDKKDTLEENNSLENLTEENSEEISEEVEEIIQVTVPQVIIEDKYEERVDEDGRLLVASSYQTMIVKGNNELLADTIKMWSDNNEESILAQTDSWAEFAKEDDFSSTNYSIDDYIQTKRVDNRILSFCVNSYSYMGGAHGNYGTYGYVYDVESGTKLELNDVVVSQDGFIEAANRYICNKLENQFGDMLFPEYRESLEYMWENGFVNWYITATGIDIILNPYEVGPYAMGQVEVELPYLNFDSYFKSEYFGKTTIGIAELGKNCEIELPDGSAVSFVVTESDEYGQSSVIITTDRDTVEENDLAYLEDAYLINKEDGRSFILMSTDFASDDFTMNVYEVTGGYIQKTDEVFGISFGGGWVDTQSLSLRQRVEVLGSYSIFVLYIIDEDGKLVCTEKVLKVPESTNSEWYILTTKKELPVNIDGKETSLPVGTKIKMTGTDDSSIILFRIVETGEEGYIEFSRGSGDDRWMIYIDGIHEYEYFESLPYAG